MAFINGRKVIQARGVPGLTHGRFGEQTRQERALDVAFDLCATRQRVIGGA